MVFRAIFDFFRRSDDFLDDIFRFKRSDIDAASRAIIQSVVNKGYNRARSLANRAQIRREDSLPILIKKLLLQEPDLQSEGITSDILAEMLFELNAQPFTDEIALKVRNIIHLSDVNGLEIWRLNLNVLGKELKEMVSKEFCDIDMLYKLLEADKDFKFIKNLPSKSITDIGSVLKMIQEHGITTEVLLSRLLEINSMPFNEEVAQKFRNIININNFGMMKVWELNLEKLNPDLKELFSREFCSLEVLNNMLNPDTDISYLQRAHKEENRQTFCVARFLRYPDMQAIDSNMVVDKLTAYMAVKLNGEWLFFVPLELCCREVCFVALEGCIDAFKHFPEQFKDRATCLEVIHKNPDLLDFVPWEIMDKKFCQIALGLPRKKEANIPPEFWGDINICLAAVKGRGCDLEFVPARFRDKSLCLEAVTESGLAIAFVPYRLRDKQMYDLATEKSPDTIVTTPEQFIDKAMALRVVSQDGLLIRYIPDRLKDKDVCLAAVKQNGGAIDIIKNDLGQDKDVWLAALLDKKNIIIKKIENDVFLNSIIFFIIKKRVNVIPERYRILSYVRMYMELDSTTTHLNAAEAKQIIEEKTTSIVDALKMNFDPSLESLINDCFKGILNYRNKDIRNFLVCVFLKQLELKDDGIWFFLRRLIKGLMPCILPLIILTTYEEEFIGNDRNCSEILAIFKTNHKTIKDKKTGLLDAILNFFMLETSTLLSKERIFNLFKRCAEANINPVHFRDALLSLSFLAINFQDKIDTVSDFSFDVLSQHFFNILYQKGVIKPEQKEGFLRVFLNSRSFASIFIYSEKMSLFKEMQEPLKTFISDVIEGSFLTNRHARNSHIRWLNEPQKLAWETALPSVKFSMPGSSSFIFNPQIFLKEKLIDHSHGSEHLKGLAQALVTLSSPPLTSQIDILLADLWVETQREKQIDILEKLDALNCGSGSQFSQDIKDQIALLKRSSPSRKEVILEDSEDWQDLFLCGTEVLGSCQNVNGIPDLNRCLLGYVLDGKCRVLVIKDGTRKIIARAIIKILLQGDRPVLLLEPVYPELGSHPIYIKDFAIEKARQMGVCLFGEGRKVELKSMGCAAPYEYEDLSPEEDKRTNGVYSLRAEQIFASSYGGAGAAAGSSG